MSNVLPIQNDPLNNGATNTVAANVRALLGYADLNQGQLAAAIGLSEMALSRRMRAKASFADNEIVAIADYLNVSPGDLLTPRPKNLPQVTNWSHATQNVVPFPAHRIDRTRKGGSNTGLSRNNVTALVR